MFFTTKQAHKHKFNFYKKLYKKKCKRIRYFKFLKKRLSRIFSDDQLLFLFGMKIQKKLRKRHYIFAKQRAKKVYILGEYFNAFFKRRFGFCFIKQTKTNIFVTLTTRKGKLIFAASGGNCQAKKRREALSTSTTEALGKKALYQIRKHRCFRFFFIIRMYFRSFLLKSFLQTLKKDRRLKFRYIIGINGRAHNGCRLKKKTRK
jgi:ribosomal protein S11